MAKYTVAMTFETPGLRSAFERKHSPGRPLGSSIRMIAADGTLAVTASGVRAETHSEAALKVSTEIAQSWVKAHGPLKMASWRADRERVLVGGRRRGGSVFGSGPWPEGFGNDEGGSAGVREPRRPKPGPGSMSMEAGLPDPE
ncbi:hypothetical protein [Kineosporia babensis]|uniref:Uncharacterized protein n=1 Tax=Kineosporia babensis TaxID=499548 RepID=A0A9X1N8V3_9ACTN|nr:hypothetical protein [Kineosporia babensis]MCD5309710.1 hypothetical protein [Kineosporia babensis]